jgi:hypothetical protein
MSNLTPDNAWRWTLLKALYLFVPMTALTFALGAWPVMRVGSVDRCNRTLQAALQVVGAERDEARALEHRVEQLEAIIAKLKLDKAASVESNPNNGYLQMGDLLICWGRATLPLGWNPQHQVPHVRTFAFRFLVEFAEPPAITTGFHVVGHDRVFGVASSNLEPTGFTGWVGDGISGGDKTSLAAIPVTMSYVAIGKPKAPGPRTGDSGIQ